MEKIYFSSDIEKILDAMDYSRLGNKVGIKIHFGENGCNTFISPKIVKKVYDRIKKLGKSVSLIESNVLYRGSRTNSINHIKTAIDHGFDFGDVRNTPDTCISEHKKMQGIFCAENSTNQSGIFMHPKIPNKQPEFFGIDILDGERGEDYVEVELDKGEAKIVKLGKGIKKYDSLIILSHFKGHMMAGFGGAFKNMGMGIASRAGKLHMHSNIKPKVKEAICTGCKVCIENCNARAIKIFPYTGKARIDPEICEGCALCIALCPNGAIAVPWHGATKEELCKKIVDYSEGVMKLFPGKIIYINVLENITKDCDCMGTSQEPIIHDIGILLSYNPVAIDKASFDLVQKESNGRFGEIAKADETQIDYAYEKKLGEKDYELVNLDKVDMSKMLFSHSPYFNS